MERQPTAVIIEDDLATQALLAAVARRCGLAVRLAGDGEAGLALILAEPPSVLIIDVVLPHVSGAEVLKRLSDAIPRLLACTIVVTAAGEVLLREASPELRRVHCVMHKPLDIDELAGELSACVQRTDPDAAPGRDIPPADSGSARRRIPKSGA
jgi:DNA-binding response OmpR family regulator